MYGFQLLISLCEDWCIDFVHNEVDIVLVPPSLHTHAHTHTHTSTHTHTHTHTRMHTRMHTHTHVEYIELPLATMQETIQRDVFKVVHEVLQAVILEY